MHFASSAKVASGGVSFRRTFCAIQRLTTAADVNRTDGVTTPHTAWHEPWVARRPRDVRSERAMKGAFPNHVARRAQRRQRTRVRRPRLARRLPRASGEPPAADPYRGGGAGEADRAGRRRREAADDRVEFAPRGRAGERFSRTRASAPRLDPGGHARADAGHREVRLAPRIQVLHLRELVDPAIDSARHRNAGPDHPAPTPRRREGAAAVA